MAWLRRLREWRDERTVRQRAIPDELWAWVLAAYPFLGQRAPADVEELRRLSSLFLGRKEFTGGQGLVIDDHIAVSIAAQACLPVLKLGLDAYDGFVGIVVQPDEVVAQREVMDDDGVVHAYDETLTGEAMEGGPVMVAWADVLTAGESAEMAYNVVIHEFAHVLDMADGVADGVPLLPTAAARERWVAVLEAEYAAFCERIDSGDETTTLDPYGAEAPEEFFAVAAEAFFVAAKAMRQEHPALYAQLAGFFQQDPAAWP